MREEIRTYLFNLLRDLAQLDSQLVLLALLVVSAVIVLDAVSTGVKARKKAVGVDPKAATVSIDGSKSLPLRSYVSEVQGLAGRPDALIVENGYIIPVERKPLARKLHDRYVAQILVYMRLVEEFEGKRPPYGYLILGPNCRSIKIHNTPERQEWLQKIIDEMDGILAGTVCAVPAPHPKKCSKCDVRHSCEYRWARTGHPQDADDTGKQHPPDGRRRLPLVG